MRHNIFPLFPSIVHQVQMDNYDDIRSEIISYIYKQKRKDPQGVSNSNWGGWQSSPIIHQSTNIVSSTINSLLGKYLSKNAITSLDKEIIIDNMRININKKGSSKVEKYGLILLIVFKDIMKLIIIMKGLKKNFQLT